MTSIDVEQSQLPVAGDGKENQQQSQIELSEKLNKGNTEPLAGKKRAASSNDDQAKEQNTTTNEKSSGAKQMSEDDKKSTNDKTNAILQRPVKRARSAYFIFADEKRQEIQKQHPGEGVAAVARSLGHLWSSMTDEQKQPYQEKAASERERVAADIKAWEAAGGKANLPEKQSSDNSDALIYPAARIRKICKLDPEVKGLSKEALLLITKVAELATAHLGQECVRVAQIQNRRKLLPDDVAQVCQSRERFEFLRDDIQDLTRLQKKEQATNQSNKKSKDSKALDAVTSKSITSFFAPKSK